MTPSWESCTCSSQHWDLRALCSHPSVGRQETEGGRCRPVLPAPGATTLHPQGTVLTEVWARVPPAGMQCPPAAMAAWLSRDWGGHLLARGKNLERRMVIDILGLQSCLFHFLPM